MKAAKLTTLLLFLFAFSACDKDLPPDDIIPLPNPGINYPRILGSTIDSVMDADEIPGLAVALIRNGEIDWLSNYGMANIEENRRVDNNTRFMLNGTADVITAMAVLQAIEQGLFGLDDDINDYLDEPIVHPTFPNAIITVRNLLAHTSGIKDDPSYLNVAFVAGMDSDTDLETFLMDYLIKGRPRYFFTNFSSERPGKVYSYSRIGLALAAMLIRKTSTVEFDLYCKTHLFAQLGLSNVSWFLADLPPSELAIPYQKNGNQLEAQPLYNYSIYPSWGLRISAEHLARFWQGMINQGVYGDQRLIEADTREFMERVTFPLADEEQSIGWRYDSLDQRLVLGNMGNDIGYSSMMSWDVNSENGVILLSNGDDKGNALRFLTTQIMDAADSRP
ncbi:MAG: serine hydrolase [Bacteroidota bacterium]